MRNRVGACECIYAGTDAWGGGCGRSLSVCPAWVHAWNTRRRYTQVCVLRYVCASV